VKEVKVGSRYRRRNGSRHPVPGFEQWPVEGLAVESDQYRTFCHARGKRREHRTFFTVLTHEQLLDLETTAFPPCKTDQERIRARPTGESGRLRIEKKPLLGIRDVFGCIRCEQPQCRSIWRARGMITTPTVQRKVFAMAVPLDRGPQKQRQPLRTNGIAGTGVNRYFYD
jgi:hypothetical protein